jgi:hypothetical protein
LPQGQVVFNNRVLPAVVAPVYDVEPSDSGLAKHGNTPSGVPAGPQTYNGALLTGAGFTAQLFGGPTNVLPNDLRPLLPAAPFRTDLPGFVVAPANAVTVGDVPEGHRAQIQLRAWENRAGSVTNWLQVLADSTIRRGRSLPFISAPLGGFYLTPINLTGLQSFNLTTGGPPALRIRINFQPNGANVPQGYLPDYGSPYGDRGNGFEYGWNQDLATSVHIQSGNVPDQRYASHIVMDLVSAPFWEMAVTNGIYRVHLAAGSPQNLDGVYRINAENILTSHGAPAIANPWIEGDAIVEVTDGRLTISPGEGSFNNRLCFVEITPITQPLLSIGSAVTNNGSVQLSFPGNVGIKYGIEATTDWFSWSPLEAGSGESNLFLVPTSASDQQFYRARTMVSADVIAVYSNNFEGTVGPEWSVMNTDVSPTGGHRFLGRFTNTLARLNLSGLPVHTKLTISFDLYVIGSWNGNSTTNGPDAWALSLTGGPVILTTTFHGRTGNVSLRQAYPGVFPGASFPALTGATELDSLGYSPDGDSRYHLSYTFPHTSNHVELNFTGGTTEALANESWGLDNVFIGVLADPY